MSETLYSQALTFHGIGKAKARHLCALTGFGPRKRINKQVLYTFFGTFAKTRNIKLLGYNLRMMTIYHIIHLRKIKTLRGLRLQADYLFVDNARMQTHVLLPN